MQARAKWTNFPYVTDATEGPGAGPIGYGPPWVPRIEIWRRTGTPSDEGGRRRSPSLPPAPLEVRIANLARLGTPIVLNESERGPDRRYSLTYARRRVREARRAALLPEHVTLDACRHGGLTALGDAGATAFEIRAMSAHKTLAGVQGYVMGTDIQKLSGLRKPDQRNEIRRFVGMSEV